MSLESIASLAIFVAILVFIMRQQNKENSLSRLVLLGLVTGSVFGLVLQITFGQEVHVINQTLEWINIVGSGYVSL